MRHRLAAVAVCTVLATLVGAPAEAATPAAATSLNIAPFIRESPAETDVTLSWSDDGSADGYLICWVQGTTPVQDPADCSAGTGANDWGGSADVAAPTTSKSLWLHWAMTFSFSVFAYQGSSDSRTYAPPVSMTMPGTSVHLSFGCIFQEYGKPCPVQARLLDADTNAPLADRHLELWSAATYGGSWHKMAELTTDSDGRAQQIITPRHDQVFAWFDRGDANQRLAGFSRPTGTRVTYDVSAHLSTYHAAAGQRVKMFGEVGPNITNGVATLATFDPPCHQAGRPRRAPVKVQRLPDGQQALGYVFTVHRDGRGRSAYSVTIRGRPFHDGESRRVVLTVGSASSGKPNAYAVGQRCRG